MNSRIYLSSPHMGGTEEAFVQEAFKTNWIAPLGPNVSGFEKDLENYLGNNVHAAALSSGTAALHLALILLGVSKGDEVICQSFTFSASANPIRYQGATPIFVDSEKDTWNMDPEALEAAIKDRISKGKRPKAVIAVHLYGMPFKANDLLDVCSRHEIPLIEDAAEALGSTYKGRRCGTFGELAILSFNGNKIITSSGGGALVTKTSKRKEKAVYLATQARDNAPHYQHSEIGYNYRLSNICAGIGRGQMEVLEDRVKQRRAIHARYLDLFSEKEGVHLFEEPNENFQSNHWLTCILIDPNKASYSNTQLREHLESLNIESRPLWKPMHLQPVFRNFPYYGNGLSDKLFSRGLCLPSGSNMSEKDWERIQSGILGLD